MSTLSFTPTDCKFRKDQIFQKDLILLLIIVSALFFRLYRLEELMVFSGETNNLLYYIEAYLAGEKPRLLGLEAAQYVHHLFHLPWYLWMMIPIYFAGGGSPLFFSVFQAAIGALEAYLMWRVGLMLGSKRIGLLAALGYAASFHFSTVERFVSPVSLVPFGIIVTIYLTILAFRQQKRSGFLLLGFWMGISVSFHFAFLLTVAFISGIIFWRRRKFILQAVAGILLAFSPMIVFDLRNNFFNLTGLWYVGKSLFDSTRPYGSSHFIYQLYPLLVLVGAWFVSYFPRKMIFVSVLVFFVTQLVMLKNYEIHPNFADRKRVVDQVLYEFSIRHCEERGKTRLPRSAEGGTRNDVKCELSVYFKNESSFDYAYLLRREAKLRGLDPKNIVIYEPWQPENNAALVVEGNGTLVYSRK